MQELNSSSVPFEEYQVVWNDKVRLKRNKNESNAQTNDSRQANEKTRNKNAKWW